MKIITDVNQAPLPLTLIPKRRMRWWGPPVPRLCLWGHWGPDKRRRMRSANCWGAREPAAASQTHWEPLTAHDAAANCCFVHLNKWIKTQLHDVCVCFSATWVTDYTSSARSSADTQLTVIQLLYETKGVEVILTIVWKEKNLDILLHYKVTNLQ